MSVSGKSLARLLLGIFGVTVLTTMMLQANYVYAAQITARSLTLQAGTTDGGSKPSGNVKHFFAFNLPGGNTVGSIQFLYCTTASGTCAPPTGINTGSATLGSQTGATGFTINVTTPAAPYITRTAAAVAANLSVSYQLAGVTNPSTTNQTFYVRISTYAATNVTGGALDTGTVAASTATQIILTGTMPESLIFCTGATVNTTAGVPDCTTATAGTVSFNQLFSPTDTATATSQMAASTNAGSGYTVTVNGATLTNGGSSIAAMNASALGVRGSGQFGMNLKLNTTLTSTPAIGLEVAPVANGTNFKGEASPSPTYNSVDHFKFTTGDSVADSASGGAGPTDAQIFTASYIVNVSGSQAAGVYTTILTYICTAMY
jgi:hypothetical protein